MDLDFPEWLHLATRWTHVFAGILWIGQTYFFSWLDGRFAEIERESLTEGKDERVWMVHSGGFYVVEKQRIPKLLPAALHWFKWEAALTWLSGFLLLVYIYYYGGLMTDDTMNEATAILVGLGSLVLSVPLYRLIWNSPFGRDERVGAVTSFAIVVLAAFAFTHVMGARAAYMHVGAMFGTVMAANVWMVIIPSQRKMIAALQQGKEPDIQLAKRAKSCSRHNTFMVVPLVFIMISNHFPTITYGASMNWLVLSMLVLAGWFAAAFLRRA